MTPNDKILPDAVDARETARMQLRKAVADLSNLQADILYDKSGRAVWAIRDDKIEDAHRPIKFYLEAAICADPQPEKVSDLAAALRRSNVTLRHYEILDGGHEAFCQRIENERIIAALQPAKPAEESK